MEPTGNQQIHLEAFGLHLSIQNIIVKLNYIDGWNRQRILMRIIAVVKRFHLFSLFSKING